MTSILDFYGLGEPQQYSLKPSANLFDAYGVTGQTMPGAGDGDIYTTASLMPVIEQEAAYRASIPGRIANWLASKRPDMTMQGGGATVFGKGLQALGLDASGDRANTSIGQAWDNTLEAFRPSNLLHGGAETANHWLGASQYPEQLTSVDVLAPLGLSAMAAPFMPRLPTMASRDAAVAKSLHATSPQMPERLPLRSAPSEMQTPGNLAGQFDDWESMFLGQSANTNAPRNFSDLFKPKDGATTTVTNAYDAYARFARENGEKAESLPTFSRIMQDLGYPVQRIAGQTRFIGIEPAIFSDTSRSSLPGTIVNALDERGAVGSAGGAVAKNAAPEPLTVYRGRPAGNNNFLDFSAPYDDLGLHFGTKDQATAFADYGSGHLAEFSIDPSKVFSLSNDLVSYSSAPHNMSRYLLEHANDLNLTKQEIDTLSNMAGRYVDEKTSIADGNVIRQMLGERGFNVLGYNNKSAEGAGRSYIALSPDAVNMTRQLYADQARSSLPGTVVNALDMSHEARMQRAKDMGFDTDTTWYHGTQKDFDEFRPSAGGSAGPGVYVTKDTSHADHFTRNKSGNGAIMPLYVRGKVADVGDVPGDVFPGFWGEMFGGRTNSDRAAEWARDNGYAGLAVDKDLVVFDPRNIRSVNASFDPAKADSANLLAADQARAAIPGTVVNALEDGQRGITAYHGSPHDFDKFSLDHIGTGEGAQAYGHGLYFAENEGVAKYYKNALSPSVLSTSDGAVRPIASRPFSLSPSQAERVAASIKDAGGYDAAVANAQKAIADAGDGPASGMRKAIAQDQLRALEAYAGMNPEVKSSGRMYEVRINADPNDFLDWDLPLSQQSEKVRSYARRDLDGYGDGRDPMGMLGAEFYRGIADRPEAAAALREAGIPGIRYLDQGSRTAGEGSRNYVLFRDDIIEVVRKYGIAAAVSMYGLDAVQGVTTDQSDLGP